MLKKTRLLGLTPRELRTDDNKVFGAGGKVDNENPSKKLKNSKFGIQMYIEAMEEPTFLTHGAKKAFN